MYLGVAGACAEQAANAGPGPFAVDFADDGQGPGVANIMVDPGPGPFETHQGELTYNVVASGGASPYTFTWTITEAADPSNVFTATIVGGQGTDTMEFKVTWSGAYVPPPPVHFDTGVYEISCRAQDSLAGDITVGPVTLDVTAMHM